jgi:hypothetical protein
MSRCRTCVSNIEARHKTDTYLDRMEDGLRELEEAADVVLAPVLAIGRDDEAIAVELVAGHEMGGLLSGGGRGRRSNGRHLNDRGGDLSGGRGDLRTSGGDWSCGSRGGLGSSGVGLGGGGSLGGGLSSSRGQAKVFSGRRPQGGRGELRCMLCKLVHDNRMS